MYVVVSFIEVLELDIEDIIVLMREDNIQTLLLPEISLVYLKLKYSDSIIAQVTLAEADCIADCIAVQVTQKDKFVSTLTEYIIRYDESGEPLEHLLADMGLLNNSI